MKIFRAVVVTLVTVIIMCIGLFVHAAPPVGKTMLTTYSCNRVNDVYMDGPGANRRDGGYIAAHNDEIHIYEIQSDGWVYGDYPLDSGGRSGNRWFRFSDLVMNGNFQNYDASLVNGSTAPVYRTYNSSSSFGTVYNTDSILVVDEYGGRKCIVYNLDAGGFKMGWVDASRIVSNSNPNPPVIDTSYVWPTTSKTITAFEKYPSSGNPHSGSLGQNWCPNNFTSNNCMDISVSVGNDVYAVTDGVVKVSRYCGDKVAYGNYIVLEHPDGSHSLYGHLSQRLYDVGQQVRKGTVIGKSGNTGNSTGPHLHFGFDKYESIRDFIKVIDNPPPTPVYKEEVAQRYVDGYNNAALTEQIDGSFIRQGQHYWVAREVGTSLSVMYKNDTGKEMYVYVTEDVRKKIDLSSVSIADDWYYVESVAKPGYVIAVDGTSHGANVCVQKLNNVQGQKSNQKWHVEKDEKSNAYWFKNEATKLYMELSGSVANEKNIFASALPDASCKFNLFVYNNNCVLKPYSSNDYAVDLYGGVTSSYNNNVQIYVFHGEANQQWRFIKADPAPEPKPSTNIKGDVNNDGQVNSADLTLLKQYVTDNSVSVDSKNADVNGDGKITTTDVSQLNLILNPPKPSTNIRGDVNNDGQVNEADEKALAEYLAEIRQDIDKNNADFSRNGTVDGTDLIQLAKMLKLSPNLQSYYPDNGYYYLQFVGKPGYVVSGTSNTCNLQQKVDLRNQKSNQKWYLSRQGNSYLLKNDSTGLYMNWTAGLRSEGLNLNCVSNYGSNSLFNLYIDNKSNVYLRPNGNTDYALCSDKLGVKLEGFVGYESQQWKLEEVPGQEPVLKEEFAKRYVDAYSDANLTQRINNSYIRINEKYWVIDENNKSLHVKYKSDNQEDREGYVSVDVRKEPPPVDYAWPVPTEPPTYNMNLTCLERYYGKGGNGSLHSGTRAGCNDLHFSNCMDIGVLEGTAVYSVDDGVVSEIEYQSSGYGHYIVIDHGDYHSLYAHLSEVLVSEKAPVRKGDLIAKSGKSGGVDPHLHFGFGKYDSIWYFLCNFEGYKLPGGFYTGERITHKLSQSDVVDRINNANRFTEGADGKYNEKWHEIDTRPVKYGTPKLTVANSIGTASLMGSESLEKKANTQVTDKTTKVSNKEVVADDTVEVYSDEALTKKSANRHISRGAKYQVIGDTGKSLRVKFNDNGMQRIGYVKKDARNRRGMIRDEVAKTTVDVYGDVALTKKISNRKINIGEKYRVIRENGQSLFVGYSNNGVKWTGYVNKSIRGDKENSVQSPVSKGEKNYGKYQREMNKEVSVSDKISNNQHPQIGNHRVTGKNGKFQHEKLNKDVALNQEGQNNKGVRNEKVRPGPTQDLRAKANVKGDVNGDGKITEADLTDLKQYFFGKRRPGFNAKNADVNGDGKITTTDFSVLKAMLQSVSVSSQKREPKPHFKPQQEIHQKFAQKSDPKSNPAFSFDSKPHLTEKAYWEGKVGQQVANLNNFGCYKTPTNGQGFSKNTREHQMNCTWYAWGRMKEVTGAELLFNGSANAGEWAKNVNRTYFWVDGSVTSKCVAVRPTKPNKGGHVAFVEYFDKATQTVYFTEANVNSSTDLRVKKLSLREFEYSRGFENYIHRK